MAQRNPHLWAIAAAAASALLTLASATAVNGQSLSTGPPTPDPAGLSAASSRTIRIGGINSIPVESLTLDELIALPEEDLAKIDIATMNLACAEGLPGSENIDREALVAQLDVWASYVGQRTAEHLYKFHEDPAEFNHSLADFLMVSMVTFLQRELGVHYNPDQITPVNDPTGFDFTRSQDLFINGLMAGTGGTCTSMPVLYVAIGRRLGYPLKLVTYPSHSLARWEDPVTGETFDIEATSPGFNRTDDQHYADWIRPLRPIEIERGNYLKSLSPREELSVFLTTRGDNLMATGHLFDAHQAYKVAVGLAPRNFTAALFLRKTTQLIDELRAEARIEAEFERHQQRLRTDPRLMIPGLPAMPTANPTSVRPPIPGHAGMPNGPVRPGSAFWPVPSLHDWQAATQQRNEELIRLFRPAIDDARERAVRQAASPTADSQDQGASP